MADFPYYFWFACYAIIKIKQQRRMLEEGPGHKSAIIKSRLLTLLMSLSKDILICIKNIYIYIFFPKFN